MQPRPAHKRFPGGRFVDVFWPLDGLWYRALVVQSVPLRRTQVVLYDDGDVEQLNLAQQLSEGLVRKRPRGPEEDAAQNLVDVVEKEERWRICLRCDKNLETVQFPCPCEEPISLDSSDEDEERKQTLVWGGQVLQAKATLGRLKRQCPGCFLSGGVSIGASICPNCKMHLTPAKSKKGRNLLLSGATSSTSGLTTEPALECTPSMGRSKLLETPEASTEDCKPIIPSRTPGFRRISQKFQMGKKRVLAKAGSSLPESPPKASVSMTQGTPLAVPLPGTKEDLDASPASFVSALQDSLASEGSVEKSAPRRAVLSKCAEVQKEAPAVAKMVKQCADGASAAKPLMHKRRELGWGGQVKTESHPLFRQGPGVKTAYKTPESKLVSLERDWERPLRRNAPWANLSNWTAKVEEADRDEKPVKCLGTKEGIDSKEASGQKRGSLAQACEGSKAPTKSTTQPIKTPREELKSELGAFLRERMSLLRVPSLSAEPTLEHLHENGAEGGGVEWGCMQEAVDTALESPAGASETISEEVGPEETDYKEEARNKSGMEDSLGLEEESSRPQSSALAVAGASSQKIENDAERAPVGEGELVSAVEPVSSESEADGDGKGHEVGEPKRANGQSGEPAALMERSADAAEDSKETEDEPTYLARVQLVAAEGGPASEPPAEAEGTLTSALGAGNLGENGHVGASADFDVDDFELDVEAALGDVERLIAEHDKVSADLDFLTPPKASPVEEPSSRSSLNKNLGPLRLRRKRSFAPRKARDSPQTPANRKARDSPQTPAETPALVRDSAKLPSPQWQDGKRPGLKGPDGSLCTGRIKKMPDIYSSPRSFEFRVDEEIRLREQGALSSKKKRKKKEAPEKRREGNGVGSPSLEEEKVKKEAKQARSRTKNEEARQTKGEENESSTKRGRSSDEGAASKQDKALLPSKDTASKRRRGVKLLDNWPSQQDTSGCAAAEGESNEEPAARNGLPPLDWAQADVSCDEGFECVMGRYLGTTGEKRTEGATVNEESAKDEKEEGPFESKTGQAVSRDCSTDLAGSAEQVESKEEKRLAKTGDIEKQDSAIQTDDRASRKRKQRQLRRAAVIENLTVPAESAEKRGVEEGAKKRQKGGSGLLAAGFVGSGDSKEEDESTEAAGVEPEQKGSPLVHAEADAREPERAQTVTETPAVASAGSEPAAQGEDITAGPLQTSEAETTAEHSDAGTAGCDKMGSPVSRLEEERHASADPDVIEAPGCMLMEKESLEVRSEPSTAETVAQTNEEGRQADQGAKEMPVEKGTLEGPSEPSPAEIVKQEVGRQEVREGEEMRQLAKVDDRDWEEAFLSLDPLSPPLPRGGESSPPNLVLEENWSKADCEDALIPPKEMQHGGGVLQLPRLIRSLQPAGGPDLETPPRSSPSAGILAGLKSPPEIPLEWPYTPFEQQESDLDATLTKHPEAPPQHLQTAPLQTKSDPPHENILLSSVRQNEQPSPSLNPEPSSPTHAQIAQPGMQSPESPEVTQQSHVTSPDLGQRTPPRNPHATIDPDFGAPSELKRKRRWPSLSPAAKKRLASMASPLSEDNSDASKLSPKESPYFGRKKRTDKPFTQRGAEFSSKQQGGDDAMSLREGDDKMPPPEKKRLKFSLLFDEGRPVNAGASDSGMQAEDKPGHVTQLQKSLFQRLREQGLGPLVGSTANGSELLDRSGLEDPAHRNWIETGQQNEARTGAATESSKIDFDDSRSEDSSYADEQPAVNSGAGSQEMTTGVILGKHNSEKVLGDSARGVERLQATLSKTLEKIGAIPKRVDSDAKEASDRTPPLRLRLPSGGSTRVLPGLRDDSCDPVENPLGSDAAQNTKPFEDGDNSRVGGRSGKRVKLSRSLRLLQAAKDIASQRAAAEKRALVAPLTSSLTKPNKIEARSAFEWTDGDSPPAYGGISARGRFIGGRGKLIRQRPMSIDELTRENTVRNTGCRIRMPRLAPGARKKKRRRTLMRAWSDVSEAIEGAADNTATNGESPGESSAEKSPEPAGATESPATIDTSPDFSLATPCSVNLESPLPNWTPSLPDLSPELANREESNGAASPETSRSGPHVENESPQKHEPAARESPVLKGPAGFGSPLRSSRGLLRSTSPKRVLGFSGGPLKSSQLSWDLAGAVARGKASLEPSGGWLSTPLKSILKKRSRALASAHQLGGSIAGEWRGEPLDSAPPSAATAEAASASIDKPSEAGGVPVLPRKKKGVRFPDESGQGQLVDIRLYKRS